MVGKLPSSTPLRSATTAGDASPLVSDLNLLTAQIVDGGLAQAQTRMMLMMKAEGIENAPR